MKTVYSMALVLLLAAPAAAQTVEVNGAADTISTVTAFAGPAVEVWRAVHSDDMACRLSRLGTGALIVNGGGYLLQRFIPSPRPCVGSPGCNGNGAPSIHVANASLGAVASRGWQIGMSAAFVFGTAAGRVGANRHTKAQAFLWGPMLGVGADALSHWLVRCES